MAALMGDRLAYIDRRADEAGNIVGDLMLAHPSQQGEYHRLLGKLGGIRMEVSLALRDLSRKAAEDRALGPYRPDPANLSWSDRTDLRDRLVASLEDARLDGRLILTAYLYHPPGGDKGVALTPYGLVDHLLNWTFVESSKKEKP